MDIPRDLFKLSQNLEHWIKEDEIRYLAWQSGYEIKRSPINGYNFLMMHILGAIDKGMGSSLTQLCAQGRLLGIDVAKESLYQRYTPKASEFMRLVSQHLLSKQIGVNDEISVLNAFNGVYVCDSTTVELPEHLESMYKGKGGGSSKSLLKLDCMFDLQSDWSRLQLKDGASSDQSLVLGAPKGSLWLRDLGYYKAAHIEALDLQGAYFVSRAHLNVSLYLDQSTKNKLDLVELIDTLDENQVQEYEVYLGAKSSFCTRLIVQRVPDEVARQKREHLKKSKKDKGRKVSTRRLMLCGLNVYITNLKAESWTAQQVMQLYKIRWQIELIFKVWKSELHLRRVPKMNVYRFECQLYAMLLFILLHHKITQNLKSYYWNQMAIELSEIKISKVLRTQIQNLKAVLRGVLYSALTFIKQLLSGIKRWGRKEVRKKNYNPLFHLC